LQTRVDFRFYRSDRHTQPAIVPVLLVRRLNEAWIESWSPGYGPLAPACLAEPRGAARLLGEAGNEIGRSKAICVRGCDAAGCMDLRRRGKDTVIADGVRRSLADRR
jgi:hypothetical protein